MSDETQNLKLACYHATNDIHSAKALYSWLMEPQSPPDYPLEAARPVHPDTFADEAPGGQREIALIAACALHDPEAAPQVCDCPPIAGKGVSNSQPTEESEAGEEIPDGFTKWDGSINFRFHVDTLVHCWMGGDDYMGPLLARDVDWDHASDPVLAVKVIGYWHGSEPAPPPADEMQKAEG